MCVLIDKILSGFVIVLCFAVSPICVSPFLNETADGVVRPPFGLVIIFGDPPSITATAEFVVPKSIPMIFDIIIYLLLIRFFIYYLMISCLVINSYHRWSN